MIKRQNRILPDLIGRLTDDHTAAKSESCSEWDTSVKAYKAVVLRDLIWLLNTNVTFTEDELEGFEYVKNSTLAFGMNSLAGMTYNDNNRRIIVQEIRNTISKFERRIDSATLKVDMTQDSGDTSGFAANHKIKIRISGALLPLQMAEKIYLKTEIDVETGKFELVNEAKGS
ncbi:MAG TPA: GPW/gp25 family protein [Victivallales bacterium]|nr:GPW/gp25 family protein [Victivallales bacterium]